MHVDFNRCTCNKSESNEKFCDVACITDLSESIIENVSIIASVHYLVCVIYAIK